MRGGCVRGGGSPRSEVEERRYSIFAVMITLLLFELRVTSHLFLPELHSLPSGLDQTQRLSTMSSV
jgi:hypothetical protein